MKDRILKVLLSNNDRYISGEEISKMMGISRAAVWKHIKALKTEGYIIESVTNKGYKIEGLPSDLNAFNLEDLLEENPWIEKGLFLETVDSTNLEAKRILTSEVLKSALIVSREQTAGKGRMGRSWFSEYDKGLWFSLMTKPNIQPEMASKITLIAAAAIGKAIEDLLEVKIGIKWPNDILINGKKVCGILTEISAELNCLHYLILGIGVNVNQSTFDKSIEEKATSLSNEISEDKIDRFKLLKLFVHHFKIYYNQFVEKQDLSEVIKFNREHSVTINKEVIIFDGYKEHRAFAMSINDEGYLMVKYEDEEVKALSSGEVSVRGVNGYI